MTVPPAAVIAASAAFDTAWAWTSTLRVSSPRASTLTKSPLRTRPWSTSTSGRCATDCAASSLERVEVDGRVLDAERVVEPLQLRHALLERHLAALEAAGDLVAGVLALGAAAGGLAALAADAATDALARLGRAGGRGEFVDAHDQLSSVLRRP